MIVVTTPTGDIGHQVLSNLLEGGEAVRVIARKPEALPPQIRERVEIVEGSHGDASVVNAAFEGADAVFWLVPPASHTTSLEAAYSDFTRPACQAFQTYGMKRVVGVSALGRGTAWEKSAGLVTASLDMDDLIASSGVPYRALTMPSFMDNVLRQIAPLQHRGTFYGTTSPDLKAPNCATRDIAAAATKYLLDTSWSGQGEVPVLGPEDLSPNDMARIMSEVLGKPVRYQQIPIDAFTSQLRERGMSEAFVQGYAAMMTAKDNGLDNAEPRTAQNTTPTTYHQWCEDVLKPAVLN